MNAASVSDCRWRRGFWYVRRLRMMTPAEVIHRLRERATLLLLRSAFVRHAGAVLPDEPLQLRFRESPEHQLPKPRHIDSARLHSLAPRLLSGHLETPTNWQWQNDPDIWHRDPASGTCWPRGFFGTLPYRPGNPYGDIRALWEPARLQQLVALGLLAVDSDPTTRQQAIEQVRRQLASWVACNPPMNGPHYVSAMECALRLIAVTHATDLLRPWLSRKDTIWTHTARIAASHAPLILRRLSLHSSRGNHTIAEAAGLVYAGVLFPEYAEAPDWLDQGMSLLIREADAQVLADGGGVEQAVHYHRVNIELIAMADALLRHHGKRSAPGLDAAVGRGTAFLAGLRLPDGELPAIGDGDDGHALTSLVSAIAGPQPAPWPLRTWSPSGYTVVSAASTPALHMILDHGPLGMPPAYGHGHADALSLWLSLSRTPVFVGCGTGGYGGENLRWRRYFRSTPAHNTVTVDAQDQARQEGSFLWSRPYHASLVARLRDDNHGGRLVAQHDGYLSRGVRHSRGIAWGKDGWVLVCDRLSGHGNHQIAVHWHIGVPVETGTDGTLILHLPEGTARLQTRGASIALFSGSETPLLGWRSPRYGEITPITTLRLSHDGPLPHTIVTELLPPGVAGDVDRLEEALKWMLEAAY